MTRAFVCGNGVSRQAVDLYGLRALGKIYGCNGLYRDFEPDCLVATDRPIAESIQNSGYSQKHKFFTRKPLPGLGALPVPKKYHSNSSGPIATAMAALDGHRTLYLLGFDMGPTATKTINNVYAGTEFYKPATAAPTFTGNWIRQLVRIMHDFRATQFVRVAGVTTARLAELESVPNLAHLDLDTFADRINNKKDL